MERPGVGIGVIIENDKGEILVGKRLSAYSPWYSIPGGHLELGETFEAAAIKEVKEETGLDIKNLKVVAVTNNLKTYQSSGKHYVSVNLHTKDFTGVPQNLEPNKCEGWFWVSPQELPQPHFDASEMAVQCFLQQRFYILK